MTYDYELPVWGSLARMNRDAMKYCNDIIRIEKNYLSIGTVNIICKSNYNIKKINDFINNYLPIELDYEIKEEYSLVVL